MTDEDVLKGKWKQLRGKAKERWGKLTDDELDQVDGSEDQLVGLLQEHYGYAREQAKNEVNRWVERQ
ncbi:MAG: CsbD family protein [Pseudohongiellaceae bacterium]